VWEKPPNKRETCFSMDGNVDNQDAAPRFEELRDLIRSFVLERDWDQFNYPKNLATAICVEAGELLEPFQWLQNGNWDELGDKKVKHVGHEMADVLIYLIALADKLNVDLVSAVVEKLELNRAKYPAEKVRGDSRKYTEYD
jgi:NTP pyrophosphatase (non-canonical NTP hydrolase)